MDHPAHFLADFPDRAGGPIADYEVCLYTWHVGLRFKCIPSNCLVSDPREGCLHDRRGAERTYVAPPRCARPSDGGRKQNPRLAEPRGAQPSTFASIQMIDLERCNDLSIGPSSY